MPWNRSNTVSDALGAGVMAALRERAASGVQVQIVYDPPPPRRGTQKSTWRALLPWVSHARHLHPDAGRAELCAYDRRDTGCTT